MRVLRLTALFANPGPAGRLKAGFILQAISNKPEFAAYAHRSFPRHAPHIALLQP
jgi:hypothetical protein